MTTDTYSFIKVSDLPDLAVDGRIENISYIGDTSYMLLSYNGKSYKVSSYQFLRILNNNLNLLNRKIEYFINQSSAQPREQENDAENIIRYPQEKYIYTYYVTNEADDKVVEDNIDFTNKKFTILSYALYSELEEVEIPFDEENNYTVCNLSDGIVTGELMNAYMTQSIDALLGAPGTLAYITDAIDSISEFTAWFEGVKNDSSYNALMSYIQSVYDETIQNTTNTTTQIISNYESADNELRNLINQKQDRLIAGNDIRIVNNVISSYASGSDIDVIVDDIISSYTAADTEITSYMYSSYAYVLDNLSNMQTKLTPGENITIEGNVISSSGGISSIDDENNKSFKIGTSIYSLQVTEDGELYIGEITDPYKTFSCTNYNDGGLNSSVEYDSGDAEVNYTLSATFNKNCATVSGTTSHWGGTGQTISANTPKESTTVTAPRNITTTVTIKVQEDQQYITDAQQAGFSHTRASITKTSTKQYNKFKIWTFTSANDITSLSINNYQPNLTSFHNVDSIYTTSPFSVTGVTKTINIGNNNEFIYLLIPAGCTSDNYGFYVGSSFPEVESYISVNLYSNNTNYRLYKSNAQQTGNVNYKYAATT